MVLSGKVVDGGKMNVTTEETKSQVHLSANKTFALLLILFIGLIALNIYQYKYTSDLRVQIERVKISVFLETAELIIEKYWLKKLSAFQAAMGVSILDQNHVIINTFKELEADGQLPDNDEGDE